MDNKASITALMSAFGRAFHTENEEHPVFTDFLAKELLTPGDIQKDIIEKAGADMKAFEHVNYCLAVRKDKSYGGKNDEIYRYIDCNKGL